MKLNVHPVTHLNNTTKHDKVVTKGSIGKRNGVHTNS